MARRRKKGSDGGGSDWLNTYADMVTLLLCFFILLFTMSTVDAEKWKALLRTFQNPGESNQVIVVPGEDGDETAGNDDTDSEFVLLKEYIEKIVKESEFSNDVEILGNESIIFIRFNNNLLFDGDSATLRRATIEFLDLIGDAFKRVEDDIMMIRVNGHTAEVPPRPGYNVSDRVLSTARANAVLMFLEEQKQIESKKLIAMGYGKNYPIAPNDTPEGRAKNRRVEILAMSVNLKNQGDSPLYKILSGDFDLDIYDQLLGKR